MKTRYADATVHDRTFDDRRRLLGATLNRLETHAQRHRKPDLVEKAFEILGAARTEVLHTRDFIRDSPQRRDAERPRADRKRTQALLGELRLYEYHLAIPSIESDEPENPFLPLVRQFRAQVQARPLPPSFSLPEGRPNLSHITTRVRARLLAAGVPRSLPGFATAKQNAGCKANVRNLHESLLMAMGLIPYRCK